jgi:hypothetical protein
MQCTQFCAKNVKNDLKPKDFLKWREYVCATQRKGGGTGELVTDEPVEVQSFKETTGHLKGIYRIYPKRKCERMSTCHRLDLETLGS